MSHPCLFHCASSCSRRLNWHAVKFNYRISFNTEGNYSAGLIAVNGTSCRRCSHTAVTRLQFGHTEIALNRTIISSHWQHCSSLFISSGCSLVIIFYTEMSRFIASDCCSPLLVFIQRSQGPNALNPTPRFSAAAVAEAIAASTKLWVHFLTFFMPQARSPPTVVFSDEVERNPESCFVFFFLIPMIDYCSYSLSLQSHFRSACPVPLWKFTKCLSCAGSLCQYTLLDI